MYSFILNWSDSFYVCLTVPKSQIGISMISAFGESEGISHSILSLVLGQVQVWSWWVPARSSSTFISIVMTLSTGQTGHRSVLVLAPHWPIILTGQNCIPIGSGPATFLPSVSVILGPGHIRHDSKQRTPGTHSQRRGQVLSEWAGAGGSTLAMPGPAYPLCSTVIPAHTKMSHTTNPAF